MRLSALLSVYYVLTTSRYFVCCSHFVIICFPDIWLRLNYRALKGVVEPEEIAGGLIFPINSASLISSFYISLIVRFVGWSHRLIYLIAKKHSSVLLWHPCQTSHLKCSLITRRYLKTEGCNISLSLTIQRLRLWMWQDIFLLPGKLRLLLCELFWCICFENGLQYCITKYDAVELRDSFFAPFHMCLFFTNDIASVLVASMSFFWATCPLAVLIHVWTAFDIFFPSFVWVKALFITSRTSLERHSLSSWEVSASS